MNDFFKNKQIWVTGAGSGIGRALVLHLHSLNAMVVAISKDLDHLKSLQAEAPSVHIVAVDLQNWENTRIALKPLPAPDGVVNNAGVALLGPLLSLQEEDFDRTFSVNVKAALNIIQIAGRKMTEAHLKGSIVNVSSQASMAALQDHAVYCSSKAALDALTRSSALELGPHGIRVNSVNPTVIMTDMGRLGWSDPAKANKMLSKIPLGRFGEVGEVINAILFLLNDSSSLITGTSIPLDGGFTAC